MMRITKFIAFWQWFACIGCVVWMLLGSSYAYGAEGVFRPVGHGRQDVSRFMTVLEDPTRKHSVGEVAAGKAGAFRESRLLDGISFGDGVFWARLDLDLSDYKEAYSYLLLDPYPIGRVEVFYPSSAGAFSSTVIDENASLEERDLAVRSFLFRIPTPRAGRAAVYVKFEQRGHPLHTRLAWVSSKGAIEETTAAHLAQGILFGVLIALVLYNTFLFFTTRDRAYALYVYYLSCFTLLMSLLTGMKLEFIPGSWTLPAIVIMNCGVMHGGMWFIRTFFELHKHAQWMNRFLLGVQLSATALAGLTTLGLAKYTYPASLALITPAVTGIFVASLIRWRQGFEPARFSAYGLVVHAGISTAYVLQFASIIPGNFITIYWMEMAAVWEALLFSFALAYRVRLAEEAARKLIAEQQRALASEHAALNAVQEATREKNTSLSMISHELRSPLQSIISSLEVERLNNPSLRNSAFLKKLTWATERIDSRLRDLFILSVGETGKLELRPEPFEVLELVEAVMESVAELAKAKGLVLKVNGKQDRIYVVADPRRVEQVLQNLVENATKYTEAGCVTVSYELINDKILRFEVKDTGIGISAEHQQDLFIPYRRFGMVDRSSTGIGLAVVKKLLMYLGGTVTVTSEVNVGSTFVVEIPVAISKEFDSQVDPKRGRKLLIVDDRQEVLTALVEIANSLGYDCDSAASAAVAGNFLAAKPYDVVFIDLEMPVKDGWELGSETRRGGGPNAETRLIAISAGAAEGSGIEGQTGMWPFDGFEPKPIERSTLLRLVESLPVAASNVPRLA